MLFRSPLSRQLLLHHNPRAGSASPPRPPSPLSRQLLLHHTPRAGSARPPRPPSPLSRQLLLLPHTSTDVHFDLSSAIARRSLKLAGSPLHFRAFFKFRPHVISGHPFCLECATQPVSNCRGARVIGIRATWPAPRRIRSCYL